MGGTGMLRATVDLALRAGLCVVPPREDGTKAPVTANVSRRHLARLFGEGKAADICAAEEFAHTWKHWQAERPNPETIERWYRAGRSGIGLVCGAVSGNLECLEFDDGDAYVAFLDRAENCGLGPLIERIGSGYEEMTPKGGVHWLYRCAEIGDNTKLARAVDDDGTIRVLIETRGEGGYVVVAPSCGPVHPSGGAYRVLRGSLGTIAGIEPDERAALFDLARSLDRMPRPKETPSSASAGLGRRPGDDFARRTSWAEILEPHGWRLVFTRGSVAFWRRPGKDLGISATTNYRDSDLLYVFSTSTGFEPERGYNKFSAHALLNHGGDFEEAARALAGKGYGEKDRRERGPVVHILRGSGAAVGLPRGVLNL
jgi:putative DNA primase/helicase